MSKFFINRPIVAIVISLLLVVGGAVMVLRLPVAQFPEIAPPQIETTAMYTGADALTVEQSVATPIDAQVNGAKRMIYEQAISGKAAPINQSFHSLLEHLDRRSRESKKIT